MGLFGSPAPAQTFTPPPAPEPNRDTQPIGFDPEALKQARSRADAAESRQGRRTLRIALNTSTTGGSGVQIPG